MRHYLKMAGIFHGSIALVPLAIGLLRIGSQVTGRVRLVRRAG